MSARSLRPSLGWSGFLLLIGAAVGGVSGWMTTQPIYRATGIVSVPGGEALGAALPPCPWRKAPSTLLARELMTSPRFMGMATRDESWLAVGGESGGDATARFQSQCDAEPDLDRETVRLHFDDPSPQVALAGAQAMLSTYETLHVQTALQFGEVVAFQRELLAKSEREGQGAVPEERDVEIADTPRPLVMDRGSLPTQPIRDARPASATVGVGAGALFGLLLAFLIGGRDS